MAYCRKLFLPLIILILPLFLTVLMVQSFHHHARIENHRDCSLCDLQQTSFEAPAAPVPPPMTPVLLVFTLFIFLPLYRFNPFTLQRGRSPPPNLLSF
jgi:hypothetical protein